MPAATATDLTRSVPFTLAREGVAAGDGLTLDGIASPFGQWTRIDGWEGTFDESFRRGAFRKTLHERTPLMQYDHGRHPLIGSIPIGTFSTLEETDEGLHVVGRLTDNWLVQPVRDAIAQGGVTGMSIRFLPVKDVWKDTSDKVVSGQEKDELLWSPGTRGPLRRTVTEAKLFEAGPVAYPAYEQTSVGVRATEAAELIRSSPDLAREIQRALAKGTRSPVEDMAADPEQLRDLARALLAGHHPSRPVAGGNGHRSGEAMQRKGTPATYAERQETLRAIKRRAYIEEHGIGRSPVSTPAPPGTASFEERRAWLDTVRVGRRRGR